MSAGTSRARADGTLRVLTVLGRFAAGKHMDGRARSDATFFAAGTHAESHWWSRGGESKWALLPGWKRAGARWAVIALITGWWRWRIGTEWVLVLTLGPAAGLAAVRGMRAWQAWGHYRDKVLPLHYALAPVLDIPLATKPRSWLAVPVDYAARPDAEIVVYPPAEFTASDRDRVDVARTVTAKLGIEAPEAAWKLNGRKPRIVFTRSQPPPAGVACSDIRLAIEAAADHELVMGLGRKAAPITVSMDSDSPHLGESMKSGDGKSEVAKNIGAQVLWHGGLLLVLDYKLISHMWARGLPNVAYAGTPYEIHVALMWLQEEIARRNAAALAGADIEGKVHADVGPRILVVAEELNATQDRLRAWWRADGNKGRPPSAEALDEALFIGRQVRVHVLMIGQRLSAKASGSGDARENLGVRVMCDPSPATWKMLGFDHAQPPASGHKGRYQVVTAKAVRETQGALWTGRQARDFALAGTVAVPRHDMPYVTGVAPVPGTAVATRSPDQPYGVGRAVIPPRPRDTATIREAIEAGLFGRSDLAAARKRVQRAGLADAGWEGSAKLYQIADLKELIR